MRDDGQYELSLPGTALCLHVFRCLLNTCIQLDTNKISLFKTSRMLAKHKQKQKHNTTQHAQQTTLKAFELQTKAWKWGLFQKKNARKSRRAPGWSHLPSSTCCLYSWCEPFSSWVKLARFEGELCCSGSRPHKVPTVSNCTTHSHTLQHNTRYTHF